MSARGTSARLATKVAARLATVGLGAVLLFLGGFAVWSTARSQDSVTQLTSSRELSDAYAGLRKAIDDERLVEHDAALGHGGNFDAAASRRLSRRFGAAEQNVDRALRDIRRHGGEPERRLAAEVADLQTRYHRAMDELFAGQGGVTVAAVHEGVGRHASDPQEAGGVEPPHDGSSMPQTDEHAEADAAGSHSPMGPGSAAEEPTGGPSATAAAEGKVIGLQDELTAQHDRIHAADAEQGAASLKELRSLEQTADRTLAGTMVALPVALLLFVVFALVLRSYRRRDELAGAAELARLEQAAVTDSLTGIRNHRAFHEDLSSALERQEQLGGTLSVAIFDLDDLKQTNDGLGHQEGDEHIRALAASMRETVGGYESAYRVGGDEFALILPGEASFAALRVVQQVQTSLSGGTRPHRPTATAGIATTHGPLDKDELLRRADLALYDAKHSRRGMVVYQTDLEADRAQPPETERTERHVQILATTLARAVDAKDSATRSHCETVAELCGLLAEEVDLDDERAARLRLAGLVHDVGKIGIADSILLKPGPLTDEEFEVMKTHSALGHGIISAAGLDDEAGWILHHHERVDGRGYPDGMAGDEIPLESRLLLVADAFEAMTADRPYRDARPDHEALEELEEHAGTQFDPACVAALVRVVRERSVGATRRTVAR